jgi:hypothetical protein
MASDTDGRTNSPGTVQEEHCSNWTVCELTGAAGGFSCLSLSQRLAQARGYIALGGGVQSYAPSMNAVRLSSAVVMVYSPGGHSVGTWSVTPLLANVSSQYFT